MCKIKKYLKALTKTGRQEILKEFRADSCIASTRCCQDVLAHFGILSEPLSVEVAIYNPAFLAELDE